MHLVTIDPYILLANKIRDQSLNLRYLFDSAVKLLSSEAGFENASPIKPFFPPAPISPKAHPALEADPNF